MTGARLPACAPRRRRQAAICCYVPIVGEAYPVSQYPSSPALQYRVSTRIWSLVYMYVVLRVLYDLIQPRLDFEILAF